MFKKLFFAAICGLGVFGNIGCHCDWECLGYKIDQTLDFANSINPELTQAVLDNDGQLPAEGGQWNHGQLNSFEKRVTHFIDKLECPPCTDPH
jgi:hypothetical protein